MKELPIITSTAGDQYSGFINVTDNGEPCDVWSDQQLISDLTGPQYKHNYCRFEQPEIRYFLRDILQCRYRTSFQGRGVRSFISPKIFSGFTRRCHHDRTAFITAKSGTVMFLFVIPPRSYLMVPV